MFLYLLAPRSHKYFNEELRKFLETGDEMAVGKKSLETKQAELRAAVIAPLAEVCSSRLPTDGRTLTFGTTVCNTKRFDTRGRRAPFTVTFRDHMCTGPRLSRVDAIIESRGSYSPRRYHHTPRE